MSFKNYANIHQAEQKDYTAFIDYFNQIMTLLTENGYNIANIVKTEFAPTDTGCDVFFINEGKTIKHVGIYNNKIEFVY